MNPEYLKQLQEQQSEHPHIVGNNQLSNPEWVKQKWPYIWLSEPVSYQESLEFKSQDDLIIEVFTDVGHGFHCVFINGDYQFIFKNERTFTLDGETYMVVNGPSYGVGEYAAIFKLMEKK